MGKQIGIHEYTYVQISPKYWLVPTTSFSSIKMPITLSLNIQYPAKELLRIVLPYLTRLLWVLPVPALGDQAGMPEEKRSKVKKGFLAVRVGLEDEEGGYRRFTIPISYLYHPQFKQLLEKAQEVYGYHTTGPLRLPCSVDDFLHLKWRIERETAQSRYNAHHHALPHTISFNSCWLA